MADFVHNKLTEWGLDYYIQNFQDGKVDEKSFFILGHEEIKELIPEPGPRSTFKKNLGDLKDSQQAGQPSNDKVKQRKRKSDHQGEGAAECTPGKRQHESLASEAKIKSIVKETMQSVDARIDSQGKIKMKDFLQDKIKELETDKRELVGVFGKTGVGKSSLINAVIGEEDLLPSGEIIACTTVMMKVEANMDDDKYRAEIEFIKIEEWKNEYWSIQTRLQKNPKDNLEDFGEITEKLTAVYGEKWKAKLAERSTDLKHSKEFKSLIGQKKTLIAKTAGELSEQLVKYTKNYLIPEEGQDVKRSYWPLVKCVTIKVPNNDFLQHVTIVDLPGNGDRNKSRDNMWREIVGNCSAVWIVADIFRPLSEKEPWEILEEVSRLIGNGGECRHIGFIVTKFDLLKNPTQSVKPEVEKQIKRLDKLYKHFSQGCVEIFTVSSTEFFEQMESQNNEIPKLQDFLKKLNDCHSETLNYVSGAHGILSLIEGARLREATDEKAAVHEKLKENLKNHLDKVEGTVTEALRTFERCLSEGVEKSRSSWKGKLEGIFKLREKQLINNKTLRCIVENGGIHKTGGGTRINLNVELASSLLDSIDNEFRETFPNEGKRGPFNGVINQISLNTEVLIQENKKVELQLIFLKTEEEKIKKELNKIIRDEKKLIYNCLTETIKEAMTDCYNDAAKRTGHGMVTEMVRTIERHVQNSEGMFQQAKDAMLSKLAELKVRILEKLKTTMTTSINLSLMDAYSLPDVSKELKTVRKLYIELKGSSAEQPSDTE